MDLKKQSHILKNVLKKDKKSIYLIIIISFFIRLIGISKEPYWVDEAISIRQVSKPFIENIVMVMFDVHPPLHNIILWFWTRIFGFQEIATRFLSLIFSVTSVYLIYLIGKKIFNRNIGIISALILTFSKIHVYYAHETRMYSLLLFLSLLSIYYFLDFEKNKNSKLKYILTNIFLIYTHVFAWFIPFIKGIYLIFFEKKKFILWLRIYSFVLISFIPWIPVILYQFFKIKGSFWILKPNISTLILTMKDFSGSNLLMYLFGFILIIGLTIYLFNLKKIKDFDKKIIFLLIWFFIPIIILYLFSIIIKPLYLTRYILFCSFGLYILIAYFITIISKNKIIQWIIVILIILLSLISLHNQYLTPSKQDWREATKIIKEEYSPEEIVLIQPFYEINAFSFYFDKYCFKKRSIFDNKNDIEKMDCKKGKNIYGINFLPEDKSFLEGKTTWLLYNNINIIDMDKNVFNWLNSTKKLVYFKTVNYINIYKFEDYR